MVTPRIRQDRSKNVSGRWFSRLLALPLCGLILLGQAGLGVALPTSQAAPKKNQGSDTLAHSKAILPHTSKPIGTGSDPRVATASQRGANVHTHGLGLDPAPGPDLSIIKTYPAGNYIGGQNITYTLTVSNSNSAGPVDSGPITVTDNMPAGLSNISVTGTDWSFTSAATAGVKFNKAQFSKAHKQMRPPGATLVTKHLKPHARLDTVPDSPSAITATYTGSFPVAPGADLPQIVVTGTLTYVAVPTFVNSASVTVPGDTNTANNTASAAVDVAPGPDFSLTMTDSNVSCASIGDIVTFTLTTINGPIPTLSNFPTITDTLPAGLTAVSATGPGWTTNIVGTTLTASFVSILWPSSTPLPSLVVTGIVSGSAGDTLNNAATLSASVDSNPTNNNANDSISVCQRPDLAITKSHIGPGPFQVGQSVSYNLNVSNLQNAGDVQEGQSITVTDSIPSGLTGVVANGIGWDVTTTASAITATYIGPRPVASGSNLPPITVTGDLTSSAVGNLNNTATVSTPLDIDSANDTSSDSLIVGPGPDLALTKSHQGTGPFQVGQTASFVLSVTNLTGSGTVLAGKSITVTDPISPALSNPVAAGTDWTTSIVGGILTATYNGTLPISAGTTLPDIVLTGQLTGDAVPTLNNSASVSTPDDSNASNDNATDSIPVLPLPDLTVSLAHQGSGCVVNGITDYTLQVSDVNTAGPVLSGPISISATLPDALAGVSATATSGWNVIANGSMVTATYTGSYPINPGTLLPIITITGALSNPGSPALVASASVTLANDGNKENNADDDVLTICPPDLKIVKSHQGTGPFQVGQNFSFVLTVSNGNNAGPIFVGPGVVAVTDQLPAGLSNVTAVGTNWTTNITGNTLIAAYSNFPIATGATLPSIVISGQLNGAAVPTLVNTASVATAGDSNPDNNIASDSVPVFALPDLAMSITHAGTGCNPTGAVNYTLIVNNVGESSGPVLIGPITVTFTAPGNLSNVSVSNGSDWLASKNGADYILTYTGSYPVNPGAALSPVTITGNVFGSNVSLSGTVTTATDGDHSNDSSTNSIAICSPNLAIVKTHNDSGVFQVGQPATFTLTVSNLAGSGSVQTGEPITVTDDLPTSMNNPVANGTNWTTTINNGILTATYAGGYPIPAGTTLLPITVTGQLTADAFPVVNNTATVTTVRDSNLSNNTSTDSIPVLAPPNLNVNLRHPDVECSTTYTISDTLTVSNSKGAGPVLPNQPITLQIPAPGNLTNVSVTPVVSGDWQVTQNNDKSWTATYSGDYPVAVDSVLSALTITGDATSYTPSLSATVTTPFDSDNSNDSTMDTQAICPPDLAIAKTHTGTAPFQAGQSVDFILNVSDVADSGPVLTGNTITVNDALPDGLVSVVANGTPDWTTSIVSNTLVATYTGSLPINPGTTLTPLHLSGQLTGDAMPTLSNTATVSGVANDSNPDNNLATDSFPVISTPDLALSVTGPQSCLHIGDAVNYSLQVSNVSDAGSVLASSPVTVSIPIPANLSNVTIGGGWHGSTGPMNGGSTVTMTYAGSYPIAPGVSLPAITISGTFTTAGDTFAASGLVGASSDSNSSNDEGSVTLTMCGPDLRISKDHEGTGPFIVGNTVNYLLKVSLAAGSNPIVDLPITVTDVLPAGLSSIVTAGTGWSFTTDNGTLTATYIGPYPLTTDSVIPSITLSGQLNTTALPILFNTATVNVPGDINPSNNSRTDQIPVRVAPDLRLHVNSPSNCVRHSNKATFTFAVSSDSQAGPIITPITLSFKVPSGLDKVSFSGSAWDWHKNGSTVTANYIGNFPVTPGQSLSLFKMTGVVTKSAGGTVGFSAIVTVGNDSHTSNNVSYGKLKVCNRLVTGNGGTGISGNNPGGSNNNNGHHGSTTGNGSSHNNGNNPGSNGGQGYPGLPPTGSDPERRSA